MDISLPRDVSPDQVRYIGYHLAPIPLAPDSVILPGNWGRIIALDGENHECYSREKTLEAIRAAEFPDKPRRHASTFYFADMTHALWQHANKDRRSLLYLVIPSLPEAPTHLGYMSCMPPLEGYEDEDTARHYWRGSLRVVVGEFGTALEEVVIESPLRVLGNIPITPEMFHP